jgi:hypothetical protein
VQYNDYCDTPRGGYSYQKRDHGCHYRPLFTAIDAGTGDFIMSWTRPEPTPTPT